jgi:ATP-dependent helicase/nuclease subunit B
VPSTVELIVGPARSGKGRRVLAAYLEALDRSEPGRCLMLVPTALRRRATEGRLLAAQQAGVLMAPQVLEFHELADRLLSAAGRPVRRISELARRQVIRRCLDTLDKKNADVLGAALATPGLVRALDELFRELKNARVEPDVFGQALVGDMRTPRNRVLAILYDAYQKALQAREVYDDAGQFWHAAALVAEEKFGPFADLEILVVDGFQDFAPAQLDMLEALSRRARHTIMTLTWQPGRTNLFAVTGRTRDHLREKFGERLVEKVIDEPSDLPPDLDRVRTHLFSPAAGATMSATGVIEIIQAAGRTREIETVARRVADLLARSPERPPSIALVVRGLGSYAGLVRQIFPRYGIPFRVASGRTLSECPVVRAAMALPRLQASGYSFRTLEAVVKSNYFVPSTCGADAETARRAVTLAREANVWEGRENYARGFDFLRSRLRREADAVDDSDRPALPGRDQAARLAEIDRAAAMLSRLFDLLVMPAQDRRTAMAERLREVIRAAGLWDSARGAPSPEGRARDLKALAAMEDVLDEVALLGEDEDRKVSLEEFLEEVSQGLALATIPTEEPEDAPVAVLDVHQARALSFDHVFLLGLAEKEFPRRGRRHPFFDDIERRILRAHGVDLPDADLDASGEMLLFYLSATRAREHLALVYPSLDTEGRPVLASHYIEELADLFSRGPDGSSLPLSAVNTRDLAVPLAESRCERELLAAAMFDLWGPGQADRAADENLAILDAMLAGSPAAETALSGLAAEWEREHGEAFGPFDGRLSADDIIEQLCRRFPGHAAMSANRLEAFGGCPFAFFASHVLDLSPVEEPSPDLAPMDLGIIYHGLLERFFRAVAESTQLAGRVTEDDLEAAISLLEKVAATYFGGLERFGRVGSPALWKVQRDNILRDVRQMLAWHAAKLAGWRAAYTEVEFGAAGGDASAPPSPPGRCEPITVDTKHGPVRIAGRIDRIDLGEGEASGFQVIDYKTGSSPSKADMAAGTSFQLPIYLWAAETIPEIAGHSGIARAFFLPIRKPGLSAALTSANSKGKPNPAYMATLDRAETYIRNFIDAMRLGLFAVYPRGRGCPEFCDYKGLCRYAAWRIDRKWEQHPLEQLRVLATDTEPGGEDGEEADA